MGKPKQSGTTTNNGGGDPTKNVLDLVNEAVRRLDDLRMAETAHITEVTALRAQHMREISDVRASYEAVIAEKEQERIEVMRTQVADLASTAALNLDRRLDPIQKNIEEIRQFQYMAQGQTTQVSEHRVEDRAKSSNAGMWIGVGVAALIGAFSLVLGIVNVMLKLQGGG